MRGKDYCNCHQANAYLELLKWSRSVINDSITEKGTQIGEVFNLQNAIDKVIKEHESEP